MDIGLDIDEVLLPFVDLLEDHCISAGIEYEFDRSKYDFYAPRWDRKRFTDICKQAVEEHEFYQYGIYPDAKEFMDNIHNAGHKIHLVTNRFLAGGELDKFATLKWLENYKLPFDSLTLTTDKRDVGVDLFLDDYLFNYDQLDSAGIDVWLMNRPHNQSEDNRRRVNTLSDFYNIIELQTIAKSVDL